MTSACAEADQALADAQAAGLTPVPHAVLLGEAWRLRGSLRVTDACYVACARLLGGVLLTTDARLARAAMPEVSVTVVR